MTPLIAGIELGGTKCVAVLARGRDILDRLIVPTAAPAPTLAAMLDQIAAWHSSAPVAAIGIASFGPIVLDPADPAFGRIGKTPKPGWSDIDVHGPVAQRFGVPTGFDTDVAGAALAEGCWGAAQGCTDHLYLTIGTGVGAGIVVGGRIVHGSGHPEAGHIRVRRVAGDIFRGACRFHGDCLEGLVAGPALAARTGLVADAISDDHPVWANVAAELAEALSMLILTLAPQRIVVGGGIAMKRTALLPQAVRRTADLIAGYLPGSDALSLARVIVPAGLGNDAGQLGAIALGQAALARFEPAGHDEQSRPPSS